VRIRLRHSDLDAFVEKFAPNVTRGGVFLATRHPQPVGALVAFEIQLAGGAVVLSGQGRVMWVREWNPAEPGRPHGIGVQFVQVDDATRPILARILRLKEAAAAAGVATRIGTSGAIDASTGRRVGSSSGSVLPGGIDLTSGPNGPTPTAASGPVDTGVDLAAEFGVDTGTLRALIDRTWMSGVRADDDLSDLLKAEPVGQVTLAQALGDLSRFLGPQANRRRATGRLRTTEPVGDAPTSPVVAATRAPSIGAPAAPGAEPVGPDDSAAPKEPSPPESDITDLSPVAAAHEATPTRDLSREPPANNHLH
jgi:uncharacterized protein (TIGR02266 family)